MKKSQILFFSRILPILIVLLLIFQSPGIAANLFVGESEGDVYLPVIMKLFNNNTLSRV